MNQPPVSFSRFFKTCTYIVLSLVLSACGDDNNKGGGAGPAIGFVVTSGSAVGNLSTLTSTTPRTAEKDVLGSIGLHSDAVIRSFGGRLYIIQRLGSNSIAVIDPSDPSAVLANYTTNDTGSPDQSNPHDMAFVNAAKAYISRYSLNTLLIVNPETGAQLGTIDLSVFADSDGIVEMDQMALVDGKLFVSLQRLNRDNLFIAENDSYLVVIDTATDQVMDLNGDMSINGDDKIVLTGRNPFGMQYLAETKHLYVANVGTFSTADDFGGIEVVNPQTLKSEGFFLKDNDFGGPLGTFRIFSDTIAYATVFDASFNNFVAPFNISTGQIGSALTGIGSGYIPRLAFDQNGVLYAADRDTNNPGVQIFDTTTNQKIEGPIDTGLPPNDILFVNP